MKPMQTGLLLLIAVVLIFAVTLAKMYMPESKPAPAQRNKGDEPGNLDLHLSFPKRHHAVGSGDLTNRVATEYGKEGRHDFWFENVNRDEVMVGLNRKNCTCSEVQLFVAPDSWRGKLGVVAATLTGLSVPGQGLASSGGTDPGWCTWLAVQCVEPQIAADLASKAEELHRLDPRRATKVPGHGFGFVRLLWEARRGPTPGAQPVILTAELWMQDQRLGGGTNLEVGAFLTDGIRLDVNDVSVGVLGPNDSAHRDVYVWSSTRDRLGELEITPVTGGPFVSCSRPIPLTEEDVVKLTDKGGAVRAGYRFTISVREQLPNGARFDEGFFTHQVKIKPPEGVQLTEPLEVTVRGAVRGDVSLVGAESGINLGQFAVKNGTRHQIRLQTERRDLKLSMDSHPAFMKVKLGESGLEEGRRTWLLSVEIEPNKVSGSFPRREDEAYQDSAIYLKVEGPVNRKLRIPVKGNATQ